MIPIAAAGDVLMRAQARLSRQRMMSMTDMRAAVWAGKDDMSAYMRSLADDRVSE